MRAPFLLVVMVGTLLACACGSNTAQPGHDDEESQLRANWPTMTASRDFSEALVRYKACMFEAGYPETDQRVGVLLKDGTVLKPEPGSSFALSGAYLQYNLASEECDASSGMNAVRGSHGTADPTPNPVVLKQLNDQRIREMACMEQKGWDIPEPVTSRGSLIFDVRFESEEQKTAYTVQYYRCMAELGTGDLPQ